MLFAIRSLALMGLLLVLGCGNATVDEMQGAGPPPPWESLSAFESEPLLLVAYPMEMGNWNAVKTNLAGAPFAAALTTFEQSPLPDGYSDKQPQKDAMVKAFRDAIDSAKAGKLDELKTKVPAAMGTIAALRAKS